MKVHSWILFFTVALLWGIPYFFIELATHEGISPVGIAFWRVFIGALTLLPIVLYKGDFRALYNRWGFLVILAILDIAAPFVLISVGQLSVSSSLAGILVASCPLFTAIFAIPFDKSERITGGRFVGLVVGFIGIIALLGLDFQGSTLRGSLAILIASACYALAGIVVKRYFSGIPASVTTVGTLIISSILLAIPALIFSSESSVSLGGIVAVVVLGIFCTSLAYMFFYSLIGQVGAGKAMVITYVSPVFSVLLGVLILSEPFTMNIITGLVLILIGSWLATGNLPFKTKRKKALNRDKKLEM
ncbi:DMT family transporter [Alkalihalobacillus sp. AL-G]|uniref:DMT family transporter n=1 Tax=Alkalihalobacillus sp. AL-G TaxID=2926399 RepID=UPI00272C49A8|nr:DMT family transporter [Alkalihalobacillus sp. AL-G]WLD93603.1 DMT family transporter [Alkalihalobacillus sp. AL-G]